MEGRSAPRAQRIIPVRGPDHARVFSRAQKIRAEGDVPLMGDERWPGFRWKQLREDLSEWNRRGRIHPDAAWAALTSGSTADPRIIVRSAESWEIGARELNTMLGVDASSVVLMPAHPVSSMAAFSVAWAASTGFLLRVPHTARLRPADVQGATHLHGTPWHLRDALDLMGATTTLRWALIGGDRLDPQLRARAEDRGIRVAEYYGASELSFVAWDIDGRGFRPFPGVEVDVREDQLWVRTDQACLQVFGQGSSLRMAEGGWYTVGDYAELEPVHGVDDAAAHRPIVQRKNDPCDMFIRLSGRADHAIMTAGATVVPTDVEIVLNRFPGVQRSLVVGAPDERLGQRVAAYVQADPEIDLDTSELNRYAADELPPASRPRIWRVVEELPCTGSGKIRRVSYEDAEKLPTRVRAGARRG